MRIVLKTLFVHLFCIFFFALFYYYFSTHFNNTQNNIKKYKSNFETVIDFFLFSTTIQSGVGVSDILPVSVYGKLLMIAQQLIMISISVITIYMFTK
jgi:hypothetical protein